jgi:hypothetical protein
MILGGLEAASPSFGSGALEQRLAYFARYFATSMKAPAYAISSRCQGAQLSSPSDSPSCFISSYI